MVDGLFHMLSVPLLGFRVRVHVRIMGLELWV